MDTYICSHANCLDGTAAAYTAYLYSKEHKLNYKFVGISNSHTYLNFNSKDKSIIFLDCVPNNDILISLIGLDVTIIDHHISNKERLEKIDHNFKCMFDMDYSACVLAWKYFFGEESMPKYFEYIQDYDLYRNQEMIDGKYHISRIFHGGLWECLYDCQTLQECFDFFDDIDISFILKMGSYLEYNNNKKIVSMAKTAIKKIYEYKGLKVCIFNTESKNSTRLGNYILENFKIDFVVLWIYNHINEEYWLSFRSKAVDVSIIAQEIDKNGGGHYGAAGATTKIHPSKLFIT